MDGALLPLVLLTSNNQFVGQRAVHLAWCQYVDAVRLAGAVPLINPSSSESEMQTLLTGVDGVLLSGSPGNVHPSLFGGSFLDASLPLDPERDAWTLPLTRCAFDMGLPLPGACRGAHEVNAWRADSRMP